MQRDLGRCGMIRGDAVLDETLRGDTLRCGEAVQTDRSSATFDKEKVEL
jgi:hypothetical protein